MMKKIELEWTQAEALYRYLAGKPWLEVKEIMPILEAQFLKIQNENIKQFKEQKEG